MVQKLTIGKFIIIGFLGILALFAAGTMFVTEPANRMALVISTQTPVVTTDITDPTTNIRELLRRDAPAHELLFEALVRRSILRSLALSDPERLLSIALTESELNRLPDLAQPYLESHVTVEGEYVGYVEDRVGTSEVFTYVIVGDNQYRIVNAPSVQPDSRGRIRVSGVLIDNVIVVYTGNEREATGGSFNETARPTEATVLGVTGNDTTAPTISSISETDQSDEQSINYRITWQTNELATTEIKYSTHRKRLNSMVYNQELTTAHTALLTDLVPETWIYYQITATDGAGNSATTDLLRFQTPAGSSGGGGTKGGGGGGGKGGAQNTPPIAVDDEVSGVFGTNVSFNILNNDVDSDRKDKLSVVTVNGAALAGTIQLPSGATLTVSSAGDVSYLQNNATGPTTDAFTYTITDSTDTSNTGTVTITLSGFPVENGAPVAQNDSVVTAEDERISIPVLDNDSDPDGDSLTLVSATQPSQGSVVVSGNFVTYDPSANYNGGDSFTYTVSDGELTDTAVVLVNVSAVNDAPVANEDLHTVNIGETLSGVNVLTNDVDIDGDQLSVIPMSSSTIQGGTFTVNSNGAITYTPATDFVGTDSFTYTVTDGSLTDGGTVTINVLDAAEVPYYITGLIYKYDYMRLNYPKEVGTGVTVKYALLDEVPSYISTSDPRNIHSTFQPLTAQQKEAAQVVFAELAEATGLVFTEVSGGDSAVVTLGIYDMGGDTVGAATYPNGLATGNVFSDAWIDVQTAGDSFIPGTEGYYVLLHEIGHALGLDHVQLQSGEENRKYTVMDYTRHPTSFLDSTGYQLYDIAALQYLYGANELTTAGDDVYVTSDLYNESKAIWDAGGVDTFDLSSMTTGVMVNLVEGTFSTIAEAGSENLSIAYGTQIENVRGGTGDDVLTGNEAANTFGFTSNWGSDTVSGFELGKDTLDVSATSLTYNQLTITPSSDRTNVVSNEGSITVMGVTSLSESDFQF